MSLKKIINHLSWKLYCFVDQAVSDYHYGCKIASSEKVTLYPKRDDD